MPHTTNPQSQGPEQADTTDRAEHTTTTNNSTGSARTTDTNTNGDGDGDGDGGKVRTIRSNPNAADSTDSGKAQAEEADTHPTGDGENSEPGSNSDAGPAAGATMGKLGDRRTVMAAGALLLACGALVTYGILTTDDRPKPPPVPTAEVTYEVQGKGKADISYRSRSNTQASTTAAVRLPWKKTVRVPLGQNPIVSITLGEKGGKATCSLILRGKHVQTATAYGPFGRANCTTTTALPGPYTSPTPP